MLRASLNYLSYYRSILEIHYSVDQFFEISGEDLSDHTAQSILLKVPPGFQAKGRVHEGDLLHPC